MHLLDSVTPRFELSKLKSNNYLLERTMKKVKKKKSRETIQRSRDQHRKLDTRWRAAMGSTVENGTYKCIHCPISSVN
jgi:hypothetical protein